MKNLILVLILIFSLALETIGDTNNYQDACTSIISSANTSSTAHHPMTRRFVWFGIFVLLATVLFCSRNPIAILLSCILLLIGLFFIIPNETTSPIYECVETAPAWYQSLSETFEVIAVILGKGSAWFVIIFFGVGFLLFLMKK